MLKVSLLVVAWLSQHRLPSLPIAGDGESIASALQQVLQRLRDEAFESDRTDTLQLTRCGMMTPSDMFYRDELHQTLLLLSTQEIIKAQAAEDRLAERLTAPNRSTARGPPLGNPKRQRVDSSDSSGSGLLEVQIPTSSLPSPRFGEKGWG